MSASSVGNIQNSVNLGSQQVTLPTGGALTTATPVTLATLNLTAGLSWVQVSYTLTGASSAVITNGINVQVGSQPVSSDLVGITLPNGVAVNVVDNFQIYSATPLTSQNVTLTPTFTTGTITASNYRVAVCKIW